jgi:predicted ATPase with chaperone activity
MIGDPIFVPYAIESEGEIIKLYDALYHQALEAESGKVDERDRRWVVVKRPFVVVGGELALSALEMTYLESGRYHEAPLQMKANCGVFLIDDFGRQQASPQQILNRWIVPLEKDVDYLTLNNGQTLRIPFDVFLIFSSNLEPKDLVDEAFLRRMRHKVEIPAPHRDVYEKIFHNVTRKLGMNPCPEAIDFLYNQYYANGRAPRASDCRDLLETVQSICRFRRQPVQLTRELMVEAAASFICEFQ